MRRTTSYLRILSSSKSVIGLVLCFAGLWLAGCGSAASSSSTGCPANQSQFKVAGALHCYPTCSTNADCSSDRICMSGACIPSHLAGGSSGNSSNSGPGSNGNNNSGSGDSIPTPGGNTGQNSGSPQHDGSCSGLVKCTSNCSPSNQSCWQGCRAQSGSGAKQTYQRVRNCVRSQCSGASNPASCAQSNCSTVIKNCGVNSSKTGHLANPPSSGDSDNPDSGGSSPGSSSGRTLDCSQLIQCINGCGRGNQSCQQRCMGNASSSAKSEYRSLTSCVRNQCRRSSNQQQCIQNNCSSKYQTCTGQSPSGGNNSGQNPGGGSGSSSLNCSELSRCLQNCGQGSQTCQQNCLQNATSTAEQKYRSLSQCAQQQCRQSSNPQSCVQNRCSSQYRACAGSSSGGAGTGSGSGSSGSGSSSLNCSQLHQCLQNCGSNDRICKQNCMQQSTSTAESKYTSLAQCAQQQCRRATNPRSCIQSRCSSEYQACLGGSSSGRNTRTLSCSGLFRCLEGCGSNNQGCQQDCVSRTSQTGQQKYRSLSYCFQQNNCGNAADPNRCMENNCPSQIRACFGRNATSP